MEYSEQAKQLLGLGETQLPLSDYLSLGLTSGNISELIRMATDPELLNADEKAPAFWATVHAWYVLGQLKATEAIAPLLDLNDDYPYDKLFCEEFPKVFASIDGCICNTCPAKLSLRQQQIGNYAFSRAT